MVPAIRSEDLPLAFTPKKRKTLEAAQKYAQKGSYDKALVEYEKLLKADPKDSNLRLKIGDLHLKKGDKQKALQTYTDVAEMFSRGGFDAKAVAIYKQILRVEEESLEARTRLGECFQRMGLSSDALREFQDAFKICQKRELKREAFDLLRRVASLDPTNITNRLNLAGLFVREGMLDDAKREYTSLLEEVRRQTGVDLVQRVAEQMLHSFPDSREAVEALVWSKVSTGAHAEAIKILKVVLPKYPDDIPLRESLVSAYEGAGDEAAVKKIWREIAELYKRRGDVDKSREIMQRYAAVEAFVAGDETTTPSLLLTDATAQTSTTAADGDDEIELDEQAPPMRPAPAAKGPPPRPAPRAAEGLRETGRATPPPLRPAPAVAKRSAEPPPAPASTPADLIAEARVSLEFGDPEEAARLAKLVLEADPDSRDARDVLAKAGQGVASLVDDPGDLPSMLERTAHRDEPQARPSPAVAKSTPAAARPAPGAKPAPPQSKPELAGFGPGEDFDTLPDIEIVLEDEEDRDEEFASVEPPLELELNKGSAPPPAPVTAKPAVAARPAPKPAPEPESSDFDIEIEVEGGEPEEPDDPSLEFSEPLASESAEEGVSFGENAPRIAENLSEADFYLEQGLIDEAERLYRSVLEIAVGHPKATLRLGEIEQKRADAKANARRKIEAAKLAPDPLGDTMVRDPDGDADALSLPDVPAPAARATPALAKPSPALAPRPAAPAAKPAPAAAKPAPAAAKPAPAAKAAPAKPTKPAADEILPSLSELERTLPDTPDEEPSDDSLEEAPQSLLGLADEADDEDAYDLAAMLDEDDDSDNTGTIGTLVGVGSVGKGFADVFSAFKKGIQQQVSEGDADTHYDLAIAYKEMGLNEDAVRELETVLRTGERAIEALSLLAHCKLALGDAEAAAAHLEDALERCGDSHESAVSLRYDLAEALLAAGREAEALEAFKKVAAADADFRDVAERISRFG